MHSEVLLRVFRYRHEAEFAQGFLLDAEIPSRIAGDDVAGMYANLSLINGLRLMVPADAAERAAAVLRDAGFDES